MAESEEFWKAVKAGDAAKVEAMLKAAPELADARTSKGVHAAVLATYMGMRDVAEVILRHAPELTVHDAATVGDFDRVKALVEKDPAALDALSTDGFTPLGLAAFTGRTPIVEFLLSEGANPNAASQDENAFTALTGAVATGHAEVARLLLEAGADPNHLYEGGAFSPLLAASAGGRVDMVRLLIDHGADVNLKSSQGKTALDWANEKGHADVAATLREHGAEG